VAGRARNDFVGAMTFFPERAAVRQMAVRRVGGEAAEVAAGDDAVAVEEPLELRVGGRSVAVVMRTPGHDRELAAGFLVTEGIVRGRDDLLDLVPCAQVRRGQGGGGGGGETERRRDGEKERRREGEKERGREGEVGRGEAEGEREGRWENVLDAVLAPGVRLDEARLTRHVFTSSSCGICSKATIAAVRAQVAPLAAGLAPRREVLVALPERLRAVQAGFAASGGLHASALFSADGELEVVREDVGRHNALDKVVGHAFLAGRLPLAGRILLVSGRVSFELVQKALAAGIPCVAAISAPSTAAVELARASGQTLVGFLRGPRMNVYAGTLGG
jgi:FdhD protein